MSGLAVVVPVHDEEALLPACLAALRRACPTGLLSGAVPVRVVVVLDDCSDGSSAIVAGADGPLPVTAVSIRARNVGAARAAGFAAALSVGADWVATTDADSTVPADWLHTHAAASRDGWSALVGTVVAQDWTGHHARVPERYAAEYRAVAGHPHVHGANLGVSAGAYRAVGGMPALRTGEDVALVAALVAGGHRVLRTAVAPVRTSTRSVGRAPDGFAAHLLALAPVGVGDGGTRVRQ